MPPLDRSLRPAAFILCLLAAAATASAQNDAPPPDQDATSADSSPDETTMQQRPEPAPDDRLEFTREPQRTTATASIGAAYNFAAEYDGADGEASVLYAGASVDVSHVVNDELRLSFGLQYLAAEWEFDDFDGFIPGLDDDDPFGTLHDVGLSVGAGYRFNDEWSAFGSFGVNAAFEDGAELTDSITVSGVLGAAYQLNADVTLGFGVIAATRLEDTDIVLPTFAFNWQIDERWSLGSTGVVARAADRSPLNQGVAVELAYEPDDNVRYFSRLAYRQNTWRLSEDNDFLEDGIFQHERVAFSLGLDWQPAPTATVRVLAGLNLDQSIEFEDSRGDDVNDSDGDISPFLGAIAVFNF